MQRYLQHLQGQVPLLLVVQLKEPRCLFAVARLKTEK